MNDRRMRPARDIGHGNERDAFRFEARPSEKETVK